MTPPAHIASGLIIFYFLKDRLKFKYVFLVSMAGSLIPDIDGFLGGQVNNHRYTVFHAPFVWLGLILFLGLFLFKSKKMRNYILVFALALFGHLFLDWFAGRTAGIQIFYPFSKKIYSFCSLEPEKGNIPILPNKEHLDFLKFYLENKFLLFTEILLILVGFFVFIKQIYGKLHK
jgi:membrane-bound metal-dependent hydrolase YbcI (DUF457 family)